LQRISSIFKAGWRHLVLGHCVSISTGKTLNFFKAATAFPIFRLTMRVLLCGTKHQQRMKMYLCCSVVKLKQQEAMSHLGAF